MMSAWYTDHAPSSDAGIASHFSAKRPVLGLCLKRYSMTANGKAIRLATPVDIPIEIGLPHFIQDDHMEDDGPIYGNFKLSLQSVVCHRGNSVHSGHYICLTRSTDLKHDSRVSSNGNSNHWMRFDDLATQRITLIDIEKALKEETPYLLFYQIQPIDEDSGRLTDGEQPPPYSADSATGSNASLGLKTSAEAEALFHNPNIEVSQPYELEHHAIQEVRRASVAFSEPSELSSNATIVGDRDSARALIRDSSPAGRTSSPLSRIASKSSDGGLTKAFSRSRLAGSKKEVSPDNIPKPELKAKEGMVEASHPAFNTIPKAPTVLQKQQPAVREKSRSRLSKHAAGKGRQKPDRECTVM